MPKNIIAFFDGTAQEGGRGENTNVYQIFNIIEDRTDDQIAFYARGVGTGWHRLSGGVGGLGISKNITRAYSFISENYKAGDSIYLIGFSRGAATARSLSSFIHHFGLLPRARPELIRRAYRIYKTRDPDSRQEKAEEFVHRHHTMWVRIKFLGCYDTVAALGLSWHLPSQLLDRIPGLQHRFHNLRLSESVENACQALAIDDERKTFHPELWDPETLDYQTLTQVWFAGMHTDIGGGYTERGLSDVPLVWLIDQAIDHGLRVYPDHRLDIKPDPLARMHDSRGRWFLKLYRRQVRSWPDDRQDLPVVHASVVERANASPRPPGDRSIPRWILERDHEIEKWDTYKERDWYRRSEEEPLPFGDRAGRILRR
jgi:uncharacterized protein (DUF2235 family)